MYYLSVKGLPTGQVKLPVPHNNWDNLLCPPHHSDLTQQRFSFHSCRVIWCLCSALSLSSLSRLMEHCRWHITSARMHRQVAWLACLNWDGKPPCSFRECRGRLLNSDSIYPPARLTTRPRTPASALAHTPAPCSPAGWGQCSSGNFVKRKAAQVWRMGLGWKRSAPAPTYPAQPAAAFPAVGEVLTAVPGSQQPAKDSHWLRVQEFVS